MNNTQIALDWIAAARVALMSYAELVNPDYEANWHHEVVAEHLEAVMRGEIRRLMVHLPPRYGKTEECSILFPSWYLGHKPQHEIMLGSYSDSLAREFGRKTRNIIEQPLFNEIFPDTHIVQDKRAHNDWRTSKGGGYYSVGRGGTAAGRGADLLILDDLIKNQQEAESETYQKMIFDFYTSVLSNRLNGPHAAIILPMTRWNKKDVSGKIQDMAKHSGEDWTILELPAEARKDEIWHTAFKTYKRAKGDPLWDKRHDKKALEKEKIKQGRFWNPVYQQSVQDEQGALIKRRWLTDNEYTELPPSGIKFISIDSAFEDNATADYSAFGAYLEADDLLYKTHLWYERLEFNELEDFTIELFKKIEPDFILIEAKASGMSLIQVLRDREVEIKGAVRKIRIISTKELFKDIGINANVGKREKGDICQSYIRTGGVLIPKNAPWKEEFLANIVGFPNEEHDDIWDEFMQAVIYSKKRNEKPEAEAGVW